jgi:hypothetical protein
MRKIRESHAVRPWGGGGYYIEHNVEKDINGSAAWVDYKAQQELREYDEVITLQFPRRDLQGNIVIYQGDEEANVGAEKIADFVEFKLSNVEKSMTSKLGLGVWGDGSGSQLHGLPAILDLGGQFLADGVTANPSYGTFAASSYGGTSRTTTDGSGNEWFKPKVGPAFTVDNRDGTTDTYGPFNTAEALSIEGGTDGGIETLYFATCDNGGYDAGDLIITTLDLYKELHAQLSALGVVTPADKVVDLGFPEAFYFHKAGVTYDTRCPTGAVILLNTQYLDLRPYKGYQDTFKARPKAQLDAIGVQGEVVLFNWTGNMLCTQPRRQGALTGKT